MFRVEFFIEDRNLGEALKRLTGITKELTHAYVPNVQVQKNGAITATAESAIDLIENNLRKLGGVINSTKMREALEGTGMAPTSYSYFLRQMQKAKRLRKAKGWTSQNATYEWVK